MAAIDAANPDILRAAVISSTVAERSLELTLFVADNLSYFTGHFTDFPILPGVVQLHWAVNYAQELLGLATPVMTVERLKFTCPIQPNIRIALTITHNAAKTVADFRFHSPAGSSKNLTFSQGRLLYGSTL